MMITNPAAMSVVHLVRGIFYSRPGPEGEENTMIAAKKEYEATSRMTRCSLVTLQSELRRPLRDTVPSNFFNVAREYAADSRS